MNQLVKTIKISQFRSLKNKTDKATVSFSDDIQDYEAANVIIKADSYPSLVLETADRTYALTVYSILQDYPSEDALLDLGFEVVFEN